MSLNDYDPEILCKDISEESLYNQPAIIIFMVGMISTMPRYADRSPEEIWGDIASTFINIM